MEPNIIIGGIQLTVGQAATVRVALNSFAASLQEEGLGDDEHGRRMTQAYKDRLSEIFALIEQCTPKAENH